MLPRALSRGLIALSMPLLPKRSIRGFQVFSLDLDADLDAFVAQLACALDVIAAVDPKRLVQLKRYVRRFGVIAAGGDYFLPAARAHVVSRDWLERTNETQLALNMVHESVHARLHHLGIRTDPTQDERVEAMCVGVEVDFARRLPDGEALAQRLEARLERPWWDQQEQRARVIARLRAAGMPKWMTAAVVRIRFRRRRGQHGAPRSG